MEQTANELSFSLYNLQATADFAKSESSAICQFCEANICKYCPHCHHAMCSNCNMKIHECDEKSSVFEVKFNHESQQLKPFCITHQIFANFFCSNCNEFVCVKCKRGDHQSHKTDKTCNLAKEVTSRHMNFLDKKVGIFKHIDRKKEIVHSELNTWRELVSMEIKNRKLKCVSQYMDFLQIQEDRLMAEFDQQTQKYNNSIHDIQSKYSVDDGVYQKFKHLATNESKPHFQKVLQANQLHSFLEEEGQSEIPEKPVFPNLTIHFDNISSFESSDPDVLGKLNFKLKDIEVENFNVNSTVEGIWENCNMTHVCSRMVTELKQHPLLTQGMIDKDLKNIRPPYIKPGTL